MLPQKLVTNKFPVMNYEYDLTELEKAWLKVSNI